MITKIIVRTPKGQAKKTEKRIRWFLLGKKGRIKTLNTYINDLDNQLVWEIDAQVRDIVRIHKNVLRYSVLIEMILNNKMMKKTLRSKLKPEGEEELKEMLLNQTTVEIMKQATTEELVEFNKTRWQHIKETFKKVT